MWTLIRGLTIEIVISFFQNLQEKDPTDAQWIGMYLEESLFCLRV